MKKNKMRFGLMLLMGAMAMCGCQYGMMKLPGTPYAVEPKDAKLLYEVDDIALFAGKTESDIAFDKANEWRHRNSLFMRRHRESGGDEWRLVMTSEGDWKLAEGMTDWCRGCAKDVRDELDVMRACLSKDRQVIWMVCDPHVGTYYIIGCLDLNKNTFRVLIDGDVVEEQEDGTIMICGKKTYLKDENGEPMGAAWYDLWMNRDGEVVRRSKPMSIQELQEEWRKENEKRDE